MSRRSRPAVLFFLSLALASSLPAQDSSRTSAAPEASTTSALATDSVQSVPLDTALERRVRAVASLLRCPVCLNLSVQDSPSELARDMRDVVRDKLSRGETEQQVFDYYIQRYGEWVLMKPPAHGVSLFVWLLPGVLVLAGIVVVVFAVKKWIRNPAPPVESVEAVPEEDMKRVREALAREREDFD